MHLMNISEEDLEFFREEVKVLLVHERIKIDDGQVFVERGVAVGDEDLVVKGRPVERCLQLVTSRHEGTRINRAVGHWSA